MTKEKSVKINDGATPIEDANPTIDEGKAIEANLESNKETNVLTDKDNKNSIPPQEGINEDEINQAVNEFEAQGEDNNDEFTIDPLTGDKRFKLDENGCRKGWVWDSELGRCVPEEDKKLQDRRSRRRL